MTSYTEPYQIVLAYQIVKKIEITTRNEKL